MTTRIDASIGCLCGLSAALLASSGTPPPPDPASLPPEATSPDGAIETPANAGEVIEPPQWKPSDPIRIGSGNAYLDLGLVGTFAAGSSTASDVQSVEPGGHDPNQRGFTIQGVELNLAGAVDPYFRANVNILYGLTADSDSLLELEEAWAETVSLPWNLQVRAGQIYSDFGRHNGTHLHAWAFVDTPLVNARLLGPDGLRNPGVWASWLVPTAFYSELSLGLQNSSGGTATSFRFNEQDEEEHDHGQGDGDNLPLTYRLADNDRGVVHFTDMLFTPRYAASFDLADTQTILAGASAAFGPNSRGDAGAGDTATQIYGLDLTWKWTSPRQHGGFPFVQWQTEGMLRRYEAGTFDWDLNGNGTVDPFEIEDLTTGLPAQLEGETVLDYGLYTQLLYGFRKGWVAGLRFDYLDGKTANYEQRNLALDGVPLGTDPNRNEWWRISPNLTWYPTEFSTLRLQYNYDYRQNLGADSSVWLQLQVSLGAHAAHQF